MWRLILVTASIFMLYLGGILSLHLHKEVQAFKPPVPPESKGGVTLKELPPEMKSQNPESKQEPKPEPATPAPTDPVPLMDEETANALLLDNKWRLIHDFRQVKGSLALTEKNPVIPLADLKLTGPQTKDVNKFHDFEIDGLWSIEKSNLTFTTGKNTALKVGRGENFELEGMISADGIGGWFIMVGFDQGHGYCIYNVTLKKSGSPFFICEFRGNKGLEETHREIDRYVNTPQELVWLSVNNKKLNLKFNKTQVVDNLDLPNYHLGDIIFGTYDTQYGPKSLKIHTMRARLK